VCEKRVEAAFSHGALIAELHAGVFEVIEQQLGLKLVEDKTASDRVCDRSRGG
jgi:hypothetical protein